MRIHDVDPSSWDMVDTDSDVDDVCIYGVPLMACPDILETIHNFHTTMFSFTLATLWIAYPCIRTLNVHDIQ